MNRRPNQHPHSIGDIAAYVALDIALATVLLIIAFILFAK